MNDRPETTDPEAAAALIRALFAESPDAIGVVDDESGTFVMVNPAFVRLFGFEHESEIVGQSVLDMVAPTGRELVVELLRRRAMHEAIPAVYSARGRRRDGSELAIEVRRTSYVVGERQHSLGILREIAPRESSPATAKRSDAFYRALFDVNTAVKLLIEPTTGRIVDANEAAVELYGWSLEELRQMRITDINMLTRQEVTEEMENARTGRRRYFRFRHRIAGGEVRHVEVHSGPVQLDGQQLLLSIIHDVTERDALEEQLRASQRLELVGRLAGGIAHDFNNLITVMMSSSDMLLRRTEPESPLRPFLEDLAHTARRAADLTRDLLAFSRRQVIEPRPLRLEALVSRMVGLLRRTLGAEYTVDVSIDGELPVVRADAGQLEQVVMNLAVNARDAMPDGGRLAIAMYAADVGGDDTRGVPSGRWVVLEVADEGEGMDEQTRLRVFEPFFSTKQGSGCGLGLATVHGIVAQAGGHVTVSSEQGRGSTFAVYLPPAPPGTTVDEPADATAPVAPGGGRILLVDDDDAVRSALARGLRHAGFEVTEARGAHEVSPLPPSELSRFDAVVSDVVMPGLSGVHLARELAERAPDLPVVLISGELREHDPATFPAGVRFVAKPFTSETLAAEIRAAMRRSPPAGGDTPNH